MHDRQTCGVVGPNQQLCLGQSRPSAVRDCVAARPPRLGPTPKQARISVLPPSKSSPKTLPDLKPFLQSSKEGSLLASAVTNPPHQRLSLAVLPNQGVLSGSLSNY